MTSRYSRCSKPRARLACLACHRRKVRCDASLRGAPCTNCRDSGDLCTLRKTNPLPLPSDDANPTNPYRDNVPSRNGWEFQASSSASRQEVAGMTPLDCDDWRPDEAHFTQSCLKSTSDTNVSVLFVCCPFLVAPGLHCLDPEECVRIEVNMGIEWPRISLTDGAKPNWDAHIIGK
jgi:hypothetical protein